MYEYVETPIFEDTELFARGVGESTDVVQKEMFTFEDKAGRSLTLRPEGTASICRAYVEHGMHKRAQPVKLWYWGPFFRHEAPQAGPLPAVHPGGRGGAGHRRALGRRRADPAAERAAGGLPGGERAHLQPGQPARPGPRTATSCATGCARARASWPSRCARGWTSTRCGRSTPTTRARRRSWPRPPSCSTASTTRTRSTSPKYVRCSTAPGLEYEVDPGLVRGLDYYTRTVFEFESGALGAQAALGGGGRYDGLVELLGGPPTPGVGWAAGIERILLAQAEMPERRSDGVFVAVAKPERRGDAFLLVEQLRDAGVRADMEHTERSLKGQLKQADRLGVRHTVIMGDADGAEGHADRRAARGRRRARGGAPRVKPPRANAYRDAWAGDLRADRVGEQVRVAGWVHRRRDHGGLIFIDLRDRTGLLQLVFRPEEQPDAHAAAERLRGEHVLSARGELVRREEGTVNPNAAHRRGRAQRARAGGAGRLRDPALRDRRGRPRGRGAAAALPLPRPQARAHARRDRAPPRGHAHHARAPGRGGLPGDRDADAHPLHARGRARLPGARAAAAGLLVRAAAVAPAVQAAADGGRLRALLPDRPLLSRRGLPRRPPARVHPARRGDVLRRRGGRDGPGRSPAARRARGGRDRRRAAHRAPLLRRGDAALRHRPSRPPGGPRDRGADRGLPRLGVQGLRERDRVGRRGARAEGERRVPAQPLRRPDRAGAVAGRRRPGVGGGRGGPVAALAGGEVPLRGRDRPARSTRWAPPRATWS